MFSYAFFVQAWEKSSRVNWKVVENHSLFTSDLKLLLSLVQLLVEELLFVPSEVGAF